LTGKPEDKLMCEKRSGTVEVQAVLAGDRKALARALTLVENNSPGAGELLDQLFPHAGKAHLVGVTGSPGSGKSSLVNQITRHLRKTAEGEPIKKVAIVAVDPSSPFSGGAILGDRIRMRDISQDDGVFIRSMASRGHLGGMAATTGAMTRVLDAAGYDIILIETVGAGQSEVEVAGLAHTTIVVEAPGMGDDIQAIKAGILEIADILVVNKADLPLAENTMRALSAGLKFFRPDQDWVNDRLHHPSMLFEPLPWADIDPQSSIEYWTPPLLKTISSEGVGIEVVLTAIEDHRSFLIEQQQWQRSEALRLQQELNQLLLSAYAEQWNKKISREKMEKVVLQMIRREISPQSAARELLEENKR